MSGARLTRSSLKKELWAAELVETAMKYMQKTLYRRYF